MHYNFNLFIDWLTEISSLQVKHDVCWLGISWELDVREVSTWNSFRDRLYISLSLVSNT